MRTSADLIEPLIDGSRVPPIISIGVPFGRDIDGDREPRSISPEFIPSVFEAYRQLFTEELSAWTEEELGGRQGLGRTRCTFDSDTGKILNTVSDSAPNFGQRPGALPRTPVAPASPNLEETPGFGRMTVHLSSKTWLTFPPRRNVNVIAAAPDEYRKRRDGRMRSLAKSNAETRTKRHDGPDTRSAPPP